MIEPGTQIGRYEIQRRLGRGGMGTVYVAHDPVLGRMVAIKVFAGDLDIPDARERFTREARSAAALNHPNIVTVYDFGEYSSQPFIVMEYVPGETLAALIRRKAPASIADKLRWMEELCAGAGYAHQMSVIHRDIKPANLMIDRSGRLKILDFGIARMMGTASNTMAMIGTPGYMSPEQIQGDAIDHRSDLFSIGVVLYELLSYTEPFPGDTMPTIVHRVLSEVPASLTRLVPDISDDVVAIVERLLQKRAADRFDDAQSLGAALGRARRAADADPGWSVPPTTVARRDTPPAGQVSRGTGSARKGASDAVGVAQLTPPPDPRRTDREAVARRRAEQLNAALQQARVRLGIGDLDGALDACQLALTFDETHADALALEEAITAAFDARNAQNAWAEAPAEPVPQVLAEGSEAGDSGAAESWLPAASYERTMVAPATPAQPAATSTSPITDVDRAIDEAQRTVLSPRHTPLPAQEARPRPVEPQGPRPADAPAPQPVAARSQSPGAGTPQPVRTQPRVALAMKAGEDLLARLRALPMMYVGAAAGVLLLIAAAAGVVLVMTAPVPTGTLVIDAAPWGTVEAIESEAGERQPLPSPPSTPLSLSLPAGTYQVVISGPPPELQAQRISVRVEEGGSTVMPIVRFRAVTPEEYFEQYLTAATPGPEAAAAGTAAATVAPAVDTSAGSASPATPSPAGVRQ